MTIVLVRIRRRPPALRPLRARLDQVNPHAPRSARPPCRSPARGYGAHLNGFEAFPFFAAAVIVSHVVEGANATVGWLAVAFIAARAAHMAFYLMDRRPCACRRARRARPARERLVAAASSQSNERDQRSRLQPRPEIRPG